MPQNIKIAVIGGTGKAGKYLVKQLLIQGFQIKLLLRNPENFLIRDPLIELVKGDARYYEPIRSLVNGCGAVITTIGQPVGEPTIFSQATINILRAMHEFGIKRYILATGLNVDTPDDQKNPVVEAGTAWMKANYPLTTADKQVELDLLMNSDADWTLVRLPLIRQTDERSEMAVSLIDCPGQHISATDLACFMIDQLEDSTYIRQAPFISNV